MTEHRGGRGRTGTGRSSLLQRLLRWGIGVAVLLVLLAVAAVVLVVWLLFALVDGEEAPVDVEVPSEVEVEPGG